MGDVLRVLNERKIGLAEFPVKPAALAELIALTKQGTINRNTAAETVFPKMIETGKSPAQIVKEDGLAQVADAGALETIVDQVLAANEKIAADYRGGKKAAFGRLMGETMKASGGKANPQIVKDLLTKKLEG